MVSDVPPVIDPLRGATVLIANGGEGVLTARRRAPRRGEQMTTPRRRMQAVPMFLVTARHSLSLSTSFSIQSEFHHIATQIIGQAIRRAFFGRPNVPSSAASARREEPACKYRCERAEVRCSAELDRPLDGLSHRSASLCQESPQIRRHHQPVYQFAEYPKW